MKRAFLFSFLILFSTSTVFSKELKSVVVPHTTPLLEKGEGDWDCFIIANGILPEEYIEKYKNAAIIEMQTYKIPASITLAQGMLESRYGNSPLAIKANNHFGIKCHSSWTGPTFIQDDDKKNECFRKYDNAIDSYTDHSRFIKNGSRYSFLFELKTTDYKGWAKGLKQAGYATDPNYPKRLTDLIERYELYKYDKNENHNVVVIKKEIVSKEEKKEQSRVSTSREILRFRSINYIVVKPGDTFYKISQETDKDLWQLYKYNELTEKDVLQAGQILYLQPKRNKAKEEFHIVQNGETMKSISQKYGIKLKALYKKNNMKPGEEPAVGEKLNLRKRK
jgi:LysM repeat protein